jgi:uncharacterized protein (TIGR02271 family)
LRRTVFAIFDNILTAQEVARALEQDGYDGISLLAADPGGDVAAQARKQDAARDFEALTIAGFGPAVVSGPLQPLLAAMNGAQGGLVGTLSSIGLPERDARHYYERLRKGHSLVAVESPEDRIRGAEELMRRFAARAVGTANPNREQPPEAIPMSATPSNQHFQDHVTVPIVDEELEVGKRQVQRGGIRVNSQILEEPIEQTLRLREELFSVERRPVDREASEEDLAAFKEGVIEIHETVEEPVVTKRARVVEEIVIGRETRERTEKISETVRRTHVNVERLPSESPSRVEPSNGADLRALHRAGPYSGQPFEQYEPAYRYGMALGRDVRYGRSQWSVVEPDARRAWEEQNPGTWEHFKDPVRRAWSKVSGQEARHE